MRLELLGKAKEDIEELLSSVDENGDKNVDNSEIDDFFRLMGVEINDEVRPPKSENCRSISESAWGGEVQGRRVGLWRWGN